MKGVVHPSEVSDLVPISLSSFCDDASEKKHTFSLISKSSLWMCLVCDTTINIFSTETGRCCGSYCFGDSLKNPSATVTNICEFTSSHISFQCLLVSVNHDHESVLCMFNVDTCMVVQAILIPDRITSLDVVSGDGGVCMETHYLSRRLRYMFGIVAIGTVIGHIYFLDLCLDESFNCDETVPNITIVLKQHEFSAQRRETAISKNQHIFLRLNDESDRTGKFELQSRSNTLYRYPNDDVYVSAVKYFRPLITLAVGFSFGGIQLWELHHLTLQFTISTEPHNQPIVNFAFQEPENDPRNFCYLWVIRGHDAVEENPPNSVSCATMYSMTFYKREYVKAFGALYTELQTCTKRFEFAFTNDIYHSSLINPSMYSRLLSCQVVSQKDLPHSVEVISGNESCEVSEDMSLCFITWEIWSHYGTVPASYHFAVFDLNQWYQSQMPHSFRCDPSALCPYFGIFSLDETRRALGRKELLGLCTIPQSIKKFKSLAVSEEFFYPSSLGFLILCFSQYGLCKTTYFGFQKHLLFEMAELGPRVLINPKEVFSSLIKCGLVADTHGGGERTPLVSQKEALLQLALEYHLPFFFIKCMKEWRYSDSVHEYCTSRSLLNWAWKKVMTIKTTIDRLSLSLFNCSGVDVDKAALKSLYAFRRQLNLIDCIVAGYQKYVTPRTEQGIQDLKCRRGALSSINLYLQVLLWLRSVHVLPEVCEVDASPENMVYRVDEISKSYSRRRSLLQSLNSSICATDVLLIDGIVKEANIGGSWQEKGGTGMYPPPSIYAALSGYLLDGVSTEWKHALTYYLLLDMRDSTKTTNSQSEVKKFPIIFGMSKCMVKLVKAFWYLDRKDCDHAIKNLLDPAVKSTDILLWQNHRIIKSFLYYRAPKNALKYINHMSPPQNTLEDMRLYLSVLLACGAITQAFEYQRKKQRQGYGNDMLKHFFLGCQEMGKMRELMYLPLNSLESTALIQFLSESEDARAQEALVIYHLLHCNFFEAEKINEKLTLSLTRKMTSNSEAQIKERLVDRNALVECLMLGISKTEKCLVTEINRLPPDITRMEVSLKPLSVSVKSSDMQKMSYSDFLRSLLSKAPLTTYLQTPLKARYLSHLEELPFLRPVCTPERVKLPAIVKNSNAVVNKRSLLSTSPNEYSSPAKRSRLLDNATFIETPTSKRKTPKHLAGDIASLLRTPPIHRRVSLIKSSDPQGTPTAIPQSILKKSQPSAMETRLDFLRSETPPLLSEGQNSEEEEDMQIDGKNFEQFDTENESQSKQIRFDIPIADQSVSKDATMLSESTVAEEMSDTSICSIPDKAEPSWKKSLSTLTREPLEGFLKQSPQSDANAIISINTDSVKSDQYASVFESPKQSTAAISLEILNLKPSINASNVRLFDSGIDRTVNFTGEDISSIQSSSTILNYDLSVSSRSQSLLRPPLKDEKINASSCEKEELEFDQNTITEKMDTYNKQISLHNDNNDDMKQLTTSFISEYDENNVIAEDSDNEIFYSPFSPSCSPRGNISERLGKPIEFLDDSGLCEDSKIQLEVHQVLKESESNLQKKTDLSADKISRPSRKTFSFTRTSTLTTESRPEATFTPISSEILEVASLSRDKEHKPELRGTKSSNETFTFSKACKEKIKTCDKAEDEVVEQYIVESSNTIGKNQPEEMYSDDKVIDNFRKPLHKPYVFTKSASSTGSNDDNCNNKTSKTEVSSTATAAKLSITTNATASKATDTTVSLQMTETKTNTIEESCIKMDNNKPDQEICNFSKSNVSVDLAAGSDQTFSKEFVTKKINKPARKTYAFSRPLSSTDDTNKPSNETLLVSKPSSLIDGASKTFVFSKPLYSTDDTNLKFMASGDVTNPSNKSNWNAIEQSSLEKAAKPKPSRKSYVFTRTSLSVNSTSVDTSAKLKITDRSGQSSDILSTDQSAVSTTRTTAKPSRKTYSFTRNISSSNSGDNLQNETSNLKDTKSEKIVTNLYENKDMADMVIQPPSIAFKENVGFLHASEAETYEEFYSTLTKTTPYKESKDKEEAKTFLSSPCASPENKSIVSVEDQASKSKSKGLSHEGSLISSTAKTIKLTGSDTTKSKKKKTKGKITKKIEFSFSEPHSPATPDILDALSQTPQQPLPSFMFSPPLTRGRLRQKKMDETLGSSFSSVISEVSFSTSKKPPMDPILEGIMQEKSMQTKRIYKGSATKLTAKKKATRKPKLQASLMDVSDQSLISFNESTSSLSNKQVPGSPRHSMVLRQTKSKPA